LSGYDALALKPFPGFRQRQGGRRDVMEEKFVKELDLSDYVIVG
jgi:hypothetical protein